VTSEELIWLGLSVFAIVLAAALGLAFWRRRAQPLDRVLADAAVQRLRNVLVPDGMGGQIHVEHLLLTVRGVVVIDVKSFTGIIFASDRMTEWTVIDGGRRFTFPNPQGSLYDRVAAVRQLVRDVPVEGHVLFGAEADFSKGRPRDVLLPAELAELYEKPERKETERLVEPFLAQWQAVLEATEPATFALGAAPRL